MTRQWRKGIDGLVPVSRRRVAANRAVLLSGTLHNAQASDSARCRALVSGSKGYPRHCSRGKACKLVLRIEHKAVHTSGMKAASTEGRGEAAGAPGTARSCFGRGRV
jgi:hypothetical protein